MATFPAWESQNGSLDATDEIGAQRLRLALWLDRMRQAVKAAVLLSTCIQAAESAGTANGNPASERWNWPWGRQSSRSWLSAG